MIKINEDSTKDMINKSNHPFLIHKGSYDRIAQILKDKCIKLRKFTSFSDSFPFLPLHGDSIIIFDKERLVKKKHHFLKIEYNADYLRKNNEIREHLMEGKSEDELLERAEKEMDVVENQVKLVLETCPIEEKNLAYARLKYIQETRKKIRLNPSNYFLGIFQLEKEIISKSPFNFDLEDIKYVVSNSLIIKYYGVPEEIKGKLLLLENYCPPRLIPPRLMMSNPLFMWLSKKLRQFKKMGNIGVHEKTFLAFQTLDAITVHPEWEQYVEPLKRPAPQIPDRWDAILKNLHHLPDNHFKMSVIDYIFKCYILREFPPDETAEDYLYNEALKILHNP